MDSVRQTSTQSGLDMLDDEHRQVFRRAFANVLKTKLAEFTYAQILDGLPTEETILETCDLIYDHPVFELKHTSLCDGVLEKVREFRSHFDPSTLVFDESVGQTKPCRATLWCSC